MARFALHVLLAVLLLIASVAAKTVCSDGDCHEVRDPVNYREHAAFEDGVCGADSFVEWEEWDDWLAVVREHRELLADLDRQVAPDVTAFFEECLADFEGCGPFPAADVKGSGREKSYIGDDFYLDAHTPMLSLTDMFDEELCVNDFPKHSIGAHRGALAAKFESPRPWVCNEDEYASLFLPGREGGWGIGKMQMGDDRMSHGPFTPAMVAIDNAYVYRKSKAAMVFDCDRILYLSSNYERTKRLSFTQIDTIEVVEDVKEAFMLYGNRGSVTYGQVLVWEIVTQLLPFVDFFRAHPDITILVQSPLKSKYDHFSNHLLRQWLSIIGVPKKNVQYVPIDEKRIFRVERLYLPPTDQPWLPDPGMLKITRDNVFREFGAPLAQSLKERAERFPDAEEPYILLVHRNHRGMSMRPQSVSDFVERGVSNWNELVEALKAAFPEETIKIIGDGFKQKETVEMFNGAKVIFATHGGGSFNVVWAPRDSFMVEVIPEDIKMLSVQTAAAAVGTGWIGMIPKESSYSETFTLDIDAVVHNIALALDAYNHAY